MEIKKIDKKSYRIHTIKTNRYKTTIIDFVFRRKITKDNLQVNSFLVGLLEDTCKKYYNSKKMFIKSEQLYNTFPMVNCVRCADSIEITFSINIINPEYIDDNNYLNECIDFLMELVLNPNVENNSFKQDRFEIIKNNIILAIDGIEEDARRKAIQNALNVLDPDSISSYRVVGKKQTVDLITPQKVYDEYLDLINNSNVDVFVIGNTDVDKIANLISNKYQNHHIINHKFKKCLENKTRLKPITKIEDGNFSQTQLIMLYNTIDLTENDKEVVLAVFDYIFGSGGLTSKLYQYLRNDNSLCYQVSSSFYKYDNLVSVSSSLSYENVTKAIKLVKKALKDIQKGNFTNEDLESAKENLITSYSIAIDDPYTKLLNYKRHIFSGVSFIEERLEKIKKVTKEDIMKFSKKIKLNTIYVLKEVKDEGN